VSTLSIWGVVNGDTYAAGGAINFVNASDATNLAAKIPAVAGLWTKLSGSTIYFVQGTGGPAESLKNAISNNKFKKYEDSQVLSETAYLPVSLTSRPAALCIIKPSQDSINLVRKLVNSDIAVIIDSINNSAKPQIILAGLYSSQPISVANILQQIQNNTILNADLGVAVSVNCAVPGLFFGPAASKYLEDAGYAKVTSGNLTEYKTSLDAGNGVTIPALINFSGNHAFITTSGKEAYSQTLMNGFKR